MPMRDMVGMTRKGGGFQPEPTLDLRFEDHTPNA